MKTWDNDIRFLRNRIQEQEDYIAWVMTHPKILIARKMELLMGAVKQEIYFKKKLQQALGGIIKPNTAIMSNYQDSGQGVTLSELENAGEAKFQGENKVSQTNLSSQSVEGAELAKSEEKQKSRDSIPTDAEGEE